MLRPLARIPRPARNEDGNLIISLLIILVVVSLGAAMGTLVAGNQENVVSRQDIEAAVAQANTGIADALYRIDQDNETATFCVGPPVSGSTCNFVSSSVPAAASAGSVSYKAIAESSVNYIDPSTQESKTRVTQWKIQSIGTVAGRSAAIQETASSSQEYRYAIFGRQEVELRGNSAEGFTGYTEGPASTSSDSPNPNPDYQVYVGSDGTLKCASQQQPSNVTFEYYSGGTNSGCNNSTQYTTRLNPTIPSPPADAQACPNGGLLGSNLGYGTLTAGSYVCNQPVTINGNLQVQGQVALYILLSGTSYWGTSTIALDVCASNSSGANCTGNNSTSWANDMYDYCTANTNASGCPDNNLPSASNFVVYSDSNGGVGDSHGQGFYFGGIIDAPSASLVGAGCKSTFYGALIINTYQCRGAAGGHLQVNFDETLATMFTSTTDSAYQQLPPADVNLKTNT